MLMLGVQTERLKKRLFSLASSRKKISRAKINWRAWILGGLFILVIAGLIWAILFSKAFAIREIVVKGDGLALADEIKTVANQYFQGNFLKFIPRNNILLFFSSNLADKIKQDIPQVSAIEIKKVVNGKIEISAGEREESAIWCQVESLRSQNGTSTSLVSAKILEQSKQCYFSDGQGFLFRESPEISGSSLPTFFGEKGGLKTEPIASSSIAFAADFKKETRDNGLDILGFVEEGGSEGFLTAITEQGWLVYLDPYRPAKNQAGVIKTLLGQELKDKIRTLKYIDLRIANRVYYK